MEYGLILNGVESITIVIKYHNKGHLILVLIFLISFYWFQEENVINILNKNRTKSIYKINNVNNLIRLMNKLLLIMKMKRFLKMMFGYLIFPIWFGYKYFLNRWNYLQLDLLIPVYSLIIEYSYLEVYRKLVNMLVKW